MKYQTQYRNGLNIQKMPYPVEPNKQKHYKTIHHMMVTPVRCSRRWIIQPLKYLFKPYQLHKLYQPKKPSKWAYTN